MIHQPTTSPAVDEPAVQDPPYIGFRIHRVDRESAALRAATNSLNSASRSTGHLSFSHVSSTGSCRLPVVRRIGPRRVGVQSSDAQFIQLEAPDDAPGGNVTFARKAMKRPIGNTWPDLLG